MNLSENFEEREMLGHTEENWGKNENLTNFCGQVGYNVKKKKNCTKIRKTQEFEKYWKKILRKI